ncbi:hypothetical protein RDWZM_003479 [Blomia tropicalis]|uniref:DUF19 domain-containing protein n=1 Tax=Blomia tropicalis TaxID=40697 RepID=A0A9Q0RSK4_BLOTA|nr:hypothetical protein RDWZM_003479 [Blomia tropicalis]
MLATVIGSFHLDRMVTAFSYYNQFHLGSMMPGAIIYPESSNMYANYDHSMASSEPEPQQNDANNVYSNMAQQFWSNNNNNNNNNNQYSTDSYYPSPIGREVEEQYSASEQQTATANDEQDVCSTGFVEHCLMQANSDGEQRLMLSMANNRTGQQQSERETLTQEFEGMCHVVIRFIDCLNAHYVKCSPVAPQSTNGMQQFTNAKDMFAQSWGELCADNGHIRNEYLRHATCIKKALSINNGQEQCQARFQSYFMSGQFSLDTVETAIQSGCCAFNEWQFCIDSVITKHCGYEASVSVHNLIDKASGGLVSNLCDKKTSARKSKVCMGKKGYGIGTKLQSLDPKINATLHKYIGIFSDFLDRIPDDEE